MKRLKSVGAEGAALLQPLGAADAAPVEAPHADCHGHVGVDGPHCAQPLAAVSHLLQPCPQPLPRHSVVCLFEVHKISPQLACAVPPPPPLPVAVDQGAQHQHRLLRAASPPEAKLALGVYPCRLSMCRDPAHLSCRVQLGEHRAHCNAAEVGGLGGGGHLGHQRDGTQRVGGWEAAHASPRVELRCDEWRQVLARWLEQPGCQWPDDRLAQRGAAGQL